MTERHWGWIGACSTGSSHTRAGTVCQDNATCMELVLGDDSVLLAIVSDGAGSAKHSEIGSRLVVACFARCAIAYLRQRGSLENITQEVVREWMDDVRNRIFRSAEQRATEPRQLAATLVGAIICANRAIVCHIGDGACVLRRKGANLWEVPSWPAHGEYASSTYFVTDDPEPRLQFISIEGKFSEIAMFSDGIERLALDFLNKTASERFFDPMFAPLAKVGPGRDRALSASLRKYLDSPRVLERTDDDKSLVLARRVILQ
ncbi:MAG TPA: PP2C family serine/threonine-protein phosphatase [Bryobacteraceae bacterium]|nr:PP2C family serine/threonine-protein phosphatase [Bryobacteraceae bacterium]